MFGCCSQMRTVNKQRPWMIQPQPDEGSTAILSHLSGSHFCPVFICAHTHTFVEHMAVRGDGTTSQQASFFAY